MVAHKKSVLHVLLSKKTAKGELKAPPTPMKKEVSLTEDGELDGRHAAAEDLIAAHNEKSPQKLAEALSNFIDMHMLRKPPPDSEEAE
jgi:hypothetical protein